MPNKQLQPSVLGRRVRAACASFYYARAPRLLRQRAAARLRRYAARIPHRSVKVCRDVIRTDMALALLFAVEVSFASGGVARQVRNSDVFVSSTYSEADGARFESIEVLREHLLRAPSDFFGISIRDCAARSREQELMKVITDVLFMRRAQRGETRPVEVGVASIPCP